MFFSDIILFFIILMECFDFLEKYTLTKEFYYIQYNMYKWILHIHVHVLLHAFTYDCMASQFFFSI